MIGPKRHPASLGEISERLRRGEISPSRAIDLAVDFRRRQGQVRTESVYIPDSLAGATERETRVSAVMARLHSLVGLEGVKRHVRELQALLAIGIKRQALGLAHEQTGMHMVFTGNPGTGKTTVARILGDILREMGLLPKGHMVEVERADLVGEYIGQTAQRTRDVIEKAHGGVLFIDEAYSLARGGEKDFGKESIDCLVRATEERRRELVIILAGYPLEMEIFLEQNPGLRSRFPVTIRFADYRADDLLLIAESMWKERDYQLTPRARIYLRQLLSIPDAFGGEEGNGRAMRNLVERSLRAQAVRLVDCTDLNREDLMAITPPDLAKAYETLDVD